MVFGYFDKQKFKFFYISNYIIRPFYNLKLKYNNGNRRVFYLYIIFVNKTYFFLFVQ